MSHANYRYNACLLLYWFELKFFPIVERLNCLADPYPVLLKPACSLSTLLSAFCCLGLVRTTSFSMLSSKFTAAAVSGSTPWLIFLSDRSDSFSSCMYSFYSSSSLIIWSFGTISNPSSLLSSPPSATSCNMSACSSLDYSFILGIRRPLKFSSWSFTSFGSSWSTSITCSIYWLFSTYSIELISLSTLWSPTLFPGDHSKLGTSSYMLCCYSFFANSSTLNIT